MCGDQQQCHRAHPTLRLNTAHSPRRPPQHPWLFSLAKALTGTQHTDIMVRARAWGAGSRRCGLCAHWIRCAACRAGSGDLVLPALLAVPLRYEPSTAQVASL